MVFVSKYLINDKYARVCWRIFSDAVLWRRSTEESLTTAKRKTLAAVMGPASRQLHELVPFFEGDVMLVPFNRFAATQTRSQFAFVFGISFPFIVTHDLILSYRMKFGKVVDLIPFTLHPVLGE